MPSGLQQIREEILHKRQTEMEKEIKRLEAAIEITNKQRKNIERRGATPKKTSRAIRQFLGGRGNAAGRHSCPRKVAGRHCRRARQAEGRTAVAATDRSADKQSEGGEAAGGVVYPVSGFFFDFVLFFIKLRPVVAVLRVVHIRFISASFFGGFRRSSLSLSARLR